MANKLHGHWKLEKNENMNEYMKASNVNFALRQIGNKITSYEEISQEGDVWTINITSTFKNSKVVFKLGEEITENTMDGRTMKSTFSIDGIKLMHQQNPIKDGDLPSVFSREVLDDGRMLLTCTSVPTGTEAKRYFVPYTTT